MALTRELSEDRRRLEDRTVPDHRAVQASPSTDGAGSPEAAQFVRRSLAVAALAAIALIHVIDGTDKIHETPYLGWGYVVLIIGCLVTGGVLMERDVRWAWIAAAALSAAAVAANVLSRTSGLPSADDDIGEWFEPLGLATLFAEVLVIAVAIRAVT